MIKHLACCLAAAAATWLAAGAATAAEPWPRAHPIQMIVSSAAGGGTDIFARLFGEKLGRELGQTIVVENKPGANGLIGNDAVARAKPDGYTLLFTYAATIVANRWLQPKLPHDVQKDLTPIAQIGAGGNLLVVTPDFPARNFADFLEEVKAHPDKYDYGSWGVGSGGHIAMESIKQQTGIRLRHIAYKGVQPTLIELKGGRLHIAFVDTTSSLPMIKAGDIIPIATSSSRRNPITDDVPTLNELGLQYNADAWYGLFGPAGISPDIVKTLNAAVNKVLTDPELTERFRQFNMSEPPLKSADEFRQTIADDIATWGAVIKAANITLE